jgi:FkbM family methyltransferase
MSREPRWKGVSRSLRVYHGDKLRNAAMDRLYARFIRAGDLAFDIGSHVGDRISSFRRLGARVVALEPQPLPARVLRLIHGRDADVTLITAACGDREGTITLRINSANPTVSTASAEFVRAADGAGGWEGQVWDEERFVPMTTLDRLVARFGRPAFAKIDVEGFEASVLAGLSQPLPALSFEFTTIQRDVAFACIARMEALARHRYNVALGESQELMFQEFVDAADLARVIEELPHDANSGDVYVVSSAA